PAIIPLSLHDALPIWPLLIRRGHHHLRVDVLDLVLDEAVAHPVDADGGHVDPLAACCPAAPVGLVGAPQAPLEPRRVVGPPAHPDRKSTRLNSSHVAS